MAREFLAKVATGNDLLEGDVVYFTAAADWSRTLRDAVVAKDQPAADALLAKASASVALIVGIYLADVVEGANGVEPHHFREAFRTRGPSNYPHGKQAARG